jgi:hypothetical protein
MKNLIFFLISLIIIQSIKPMRTTITFDDLEKNTEIKIENKLDRDKLEKVGEQYKTCSWLYDPEGSIAVLIDLFAGDSSPKFKIDSNGTIFPNFYFTNYSIDKEECTLPEGLFLWKSDFNSPSIPGQGFLRIGYVLRQYPDGPFFGLSKKSPEPKYSKILVTSEIKVLEAYNPETDSLGLLPFDLLVSNNRILQAKSPHPTELTRKLVQLKEQLSLLKNKLAQLSTKLVTLSKKLKTH